MWVIDGVASKPVSFTFLGSEIDESIIFIFKVVWQNLNENLKFLLIFD